MPVTAALFVSKRLQVLTAAVLCLMTIQLVLASCSPEPSAHASTVRVAVRR